MNKSDYCEICLKTLLNSHFWDGRSRMLTGCFPVFIPVSTISCHSQFWHKDDVLFWLCSPEDSGFIQNLSVNGSQTEKGVNRQQFTNCHSQKKWLIKWASGVLPVGVTDSPARMVVFSELQEKWGDNEGFREKPKPSERLKLAASVFLVDESSSKDKIKFILYNF